MLPLLTLFCCWWPTHGAVSCCCSCCTFAPQTPCG
jgi:hypothetical protein